MIFYRVIAFACLTAVVTGCGGGSSAGSALDQAAPGPAPPSCSGDCAGPGTFLTTADVETVIAQAAAEALANGAAATIAVVDRVGNVLGVYRMDGAAETVTISSTPPGTPISGGLEQISIIPDTMAAISKAVTGAYLASEGNAFTTRTASQIVQDHFNPGEMLQPGGPLFGVQFSQLPCGDLVLREDDGDAGPKRAPLGLSADPGGFPLYKSGTPVGGVGAIADGLYGLDKDVSSTRDSDLDERIALAATFGFAAPPDRRADRITVDGKTFRFSDSAFSDLASDPAGAAALSAFSGSLVMVRGYTDAAVRAGTAFGQPASGIRPDRLDYPDLDAFVLVDDNDVERYRPRDGTEPSGALQADEVREILREALGVANRARAQIRRPLGSQARVTISVVDSAGEILGVARTRDAPVFGIDVSLQKARTAAFFSSREAADALSSLPPAAYLDGLSLLRTVDIGDYVTAAQDFLDEPTALSDGEFAFSDRAGGNLSRPYYPDGIDGAPPGPFSKPAGEWSVFSVGLQLDLAYNAVIQHVAFVVGLGLAPDVGMPPHVSRNCTGVVGIDVGLTDPALFKQMSPIDAVANGIQIFPGSVPIYRDTQLVGGIGVSGDGIDQDDMISFLGLHLAGERLGTVNNAPPDMRADVLSPMGVRLRFVNCPQSPFLDSDEQDVCSGK